MAGKPLKQQVIKELERLAREDIGPQATALDYVCGRVEQRGKAPPASEVPFLNQVPNDWEDRYDFDLPPIHGGVVVMRAERATMPGFDWEY